jgi:4-hydroxy-tetrahydrodipicolinate reductase
MRRGGGREVRIIQYGLGAIGTTCARAVAETPGLRLIGAVEIDPEKAGRPLAEVLGIKPSRGSGSGGKLARMKVSSRLEDALRGSRADVVIHTTRSSFRDVLPQVEECVEAGLAVVSSTEELALPHAANRRLAARLDRAARRRGVSVLGTGVNPGFVMDLLPIAASGASRNVHRVEVERVLDAGQRRPSFQKKVGVGMSPSEARRELREGRIGHVGLLQSALLLASGCGLHVTSLRQESHPITATRTLDSAFGKVRRGEVAGLHQSLVGRRNGKEILRLEMVMALGVTDPHDSAIIHGEPAVSLRIEGGLFGDTATVSTLLNAVPRVLDSAPGLHTVLDLPVPRAWRPH